MLRELLSIHQLLQYNYDNLSLYNNYIFWIISVNTYY
jgi:hypothetical protein